MTKALLSVERPISLPPQVYSFWLRLIIHFVYTRKPLEQRNPATNTNVNVLKYEDGGGSMISFVLFCYCVCCYHCGSSHCRPFHNFSDARDK